MLMIMLMLMLMLVAPLGFELKVLAFRYGQPSNFMGRNAGLVGGGV